MNDDAVERQRAYYAHTAHKYDHAHVTPGDEHFVALEYAVGFATMFNCASVLDVGAGTGRGVRFLRDRLPAARVVGVEPVDELRIQAGGASQIQRGSGDALPFEDASFDVVIASGVMHHVSNPSTVVTEMLRVASKLVLISDSNRFGQGGSVARFSKVLIHKSGAWPMLEGMRTRGKGYMESNEDGIFYSYSVYDSLRQVSEWASRAFIIPTRPTKAGFFGPLSESTHGLLVAVREPVGTGWAGVQ